MGKHTDNHVKVYINAHGDHVMRVSEVIKTLGKDELIRWANRIGLQGVSYDAKLNEEANVGSLCHDMIEHYTTPGKLAILDYDAYDIIYHDLKLKVRRALESFLLWYKNRKHPYKVLHTEFVVVGEYLGGTIDCIIEDWDDPHKVIFVDYKTSRMFMLTHFLQLAAYAMLYEEIYGEGRVGGIMVIKLDKYDGTKAKAKLIRRKKLVSLMQMFRKLFEVTVFKKALEKSVISDAEDI